MVSKEQAIALTQQLEAVPDASLFEDETSRTQLLRAAKTLIARTEKPWETIFRVVWEEVSFHSEAKATVISIIMLTAAANLPRCAQDWSRHWAIPALD